jgi:hypothetical protein
MQKTGHGSKAPLISSLTRWCSGKAVTSWDLGTSTGCLDFGSPLSGQSPHPNAGAPVLYVTV